MEELERVYLPEDLAGTPFNKRDIGIVVFIYPGHKAYEVEFFAVDGSNMSIETGPGKNVRLAKGIKKVLHIDEAA